MGAVIQRRGYHRVRRNCSRNARGLTPATRLTNAGATKIFLADPKVASWLKRYPPTVGTSATYANGIWTVGVFYTAAGEIASGQVSDLTGQVVQQYPDDATLRRRTYFHSLDLTKDSPTPPLA